MGSAGAVVLDVRVSGHGSGSVSGIDFRRFPACAGGLVHESGRAGWGFVIAGWNPDPDGLPGRCGGLGRHDIAGRLRLGCLWGLPLRCLGTKFWEWLFSGKSFAGVSWFKAFLFQLFPLC